jgi:hypothetical protein
MHALQAVIVIQCAWRRTFRHSTTLKYAKQARICKLTLEHARFLDIASLSSLFRKKHLVRAAKSLLQRFHLIALYRHGFPLDLPIDGAHKISIRIFLTSFMLATHPREIFQGIGPRQEATIAAATRLTNTFDLLTKSVFGISAIPTVLTATFIRELVEYNTTFLNLNLPMHTIKRMEMACAIRQLTPLPRDPFASAQLTRLRKLLSETPET